MTKHIKTYKFFEITLPNIHSLKNCHLFFAVLLPLEMKANGWGFMFGKTKSSWLTTCNLICGFFFLYTSTINRTQHYSTEIISFLFFPLFAFLNGFEEYFFAGATAVTSDGMETSRFGAASCPLRFSFLCHCYPLYFYILSNMKHWKWANSNTEMKLSGWFGEQYGSNLTTL